MTTGGPAGAGATLRTWVTWPLPLAVGAVPLLGISAWTAVRLGGAAVGFAFAAAGFAAAGAPDFATAPSSSITKRMPPTGHTWPSLKRICDSRPARGDG